MRLLSKDDLCTVLKINNTALTELVNAGKIPYKSIDGSAQFSPEIITKWILRPGLDMNDKKYLERFAKRIEEKAPEGLKEIRKFAAQFSDPWIPRLFYLDKVPNKKLGFVYYVRYLKDGKIVPSHWCTHTNNFEAAKSYAIENRERLLAEYYERKVVKKPYAELYTILKKYYEENSSYLQADKKRGRVLGDKSRGINHLFIINQFIPYLRKEKIKSIEEIDTPFMARFQNYLLADKKKDGKLVPGIQPQTVVHYTSTISRIFDHLLIEGYVKSNPCASLTPIAVLDNNVKQRGCYEITKLKGVFNKRWEDQFSYLLCLLIYTTGMRNSEIERIKVEHLITIDGYHFIDIPESKTKYGVRIVPLHDFVYRKLSAYIKKNNISDRLFKHYISNIYDKANSELAKYTGISDEQLEKENITFYSGRHFWKTVMNSENLGDIEEYFMGHTVSADVAKRYNHKDKQGKRKLLEKTRKVFQILDKRIFNN